MYKVQTFKGVAPICIGLFKLRILAVNFFTAFILPLSKAEIQYNRGWRMIFNIGAVNISLNDGVAVTLIIVVIIMVCRNK